MRHPLLGPLLLAIGLVLCHGPSAAADDESRTQGVETLQAAAETGDPEAQYRLGLRYLHGEGIPADEAWAITWLRRAAAAGQEKAAQELARLYQRNGISPGTAAALALPAGELDPATRLRVMAAALDARQRGEKQTARRLLRRLAEAGETEAQYRLALLLLEEPEDSRQEALKWLQAAAEQGHTEAAAALQRYGPPKEPTREQPGLFSRLIALIRGEPRRASAPDHGAAGSPEHAAGATNTDGSVTGPHEAGSGKPEAVPGDGEAGPPAATGTAPPAPSPPASAEERSLKLAEQELVQGHGAEAARIYEQLARTGSAEAQYRLGRMYRTGEGIQADAAWAVTWLRRAARRGHPRAREELQEIYRESGLEDSPPPPADAPQVDEEEELPPVIRLRHQQAPSGEDPR